MLKMQVVYEMQVQTHKDTHNIRFTQELLWKWIACIHKHTEKPRFTCCLHL